MEGQISKIRTMAQDLNAAKKSYEKEAAEKRAVTDVKKPELYKDSSAIEAGEGQLKKPAPETKPIRDDAKPRIKPPEIRQKQASVHAESKEQPEKRDEARGEETLTEILKKAREKISEGAKPAPTETDVSKATPPLVSPEKQPPYTPTTEKNGLDTLPIEEKGEEQKTQAPFTGREPPTNLPTGEPAFPESPKKAEGRAELPPKEAAPKVPEPPSQKSLPVEETPEKILGLPQKQTGLPSREPPKTPEEKPIVREVADKAKKSRKLSPAKFTLVIAGLGIALTGIVFGIYAILSEKKDVPPAAPAPIVQPEPAALIDYDGTYTIEINELRYEALESEIDSLSGLALPENAIIYIPIKYSTEKSVKYLVFDEFANILDIPVPATLLNKEHGEFNIFLYTQGEDEAKTCELSGIANKGCYAPRIGIILDIEGDETTVADTMIKWENTLSHDLNPIILNKYEPGGTFSTGSYKGLTTRYLNLLLPDGDSAVNTTSIDWVIVDTKLVIATSMNAARSAVDKLIAR